METTTMDAKHQKKLYEYSGSPAPLVTVLLLAVLCLFLAIFGGSLIGPYLGFLGFMGVLLWIPVGIILGSIGVILLVLIPATIAINKQWQEAIILRLGKFKRLVGPGMFFKWPIIERFLRQDIRIQTLDVMKQEVMTRDNISLMVDAVVFMKVINTAKSLINILDVKLSVVQYAQTTMRDVIGNVELDDLLAKRDQIAERIKEIVDKETDEWGVDILSVNLQNIELPADMKRVIARQAEAERERRAVIIKSEGELTAAKNLEQAVQQMSSQAMYLRTLSSLEDISYDESNTIVFALPLDIVKGEILGLTGFAKSRKQNRKPKDQVPRQE
jgi:regulator of protease activity HflC (stomatin/prohibitin superfamily)